MYFGKYGIERAFPGGSVLKNPPAVVGDACLIPGLGRAPGEGNDNSRKWYSCLGNPWTEEPGRLEFPGVVKELPRL